MIQILSLIAASIIIEAIYNFSKLYFKLVFNVLDSHIFIGRGKCLFEFYIRKTRCSVGLIIPILFVKNIRAVIMGERKPLSYSWESYESPFWKRLITTFSGVLGLFISALIVFVSISLYSPDIFISKNEINSYGIFPEELGVASGFQMGDKIESINGHDFDRFSDLLDPKKIFSDSLFYEINRNGQLLKLHISKESKEEIINNRLTLFSINTPFKVSAVIESMEAEMQGLKEGDKIIQLDSIKIVSLPQFRNQLKKREYNKVTIIVNRSDSLFQCVLKTGSDGTIGVLLEDEISYTSMDRTLAEATVNGVGMAFEVLTTNLIAFKKIFGGTVQSTKTLSGPIGIAKVYGDKFSWLRFWNITGLLMMVSVFWMFLPFPKSIFWEVIPLVIESVFNKKITKKTFNKLLRIPYYLIVGLMIFAFLSDILSLILD